MTEPTAPALTLVPPPPRLASVTPTRTGPSAHPASACPGCLDLGVAHPFGDYSPRADESIRLTICFPGPHDPTRTEPLLMWAGTASEARGVLPAGHHTGYHPYFEEILTRYAALTPPRPPAAATLLRAA